LSILLSARSSNTASKRVTRLRSLRSGSGLKNGSTNRTIVAKMEVLMLYDENALQTVREKRLLINHYDDWLFDEFKDFLGQRIIEIGCGLGNQLQHFTDRELAVGLETSNESVEYVRNKFANLPNIETLQLSITNPEVLSLKSRSFDTAISLNVFEHIQDDLHALRNTYQLLSTNGNFILIVPAHKSLYGTMDSSIGHYRRYTKNMLRSMMKSIGFRVIKLKYINMLGAIGWGINARILKKETPPSDQLKIINSIVPFLHMFESIIPAPFGISVLCIGQKIHFG